MANRRLEILTAVLTMHGTGGSLPDLFWNLFIPPCDVVGPRSIEKIGEAKAGHRPVWIKGLDRPLQVPASFALHNLYQMLTEGMHPRNWHYYCVPETPVEKDDVVFDVGAAEGLFSLLTRRKGARAVIFEPQPVYFRALQENFADDEGVVLVKAALGDRRAEGFMPAADVAAAVSDHGEYPIAIETLDEVCDRLHVYPTFLKADIEGYEEKMLEGAAETIATYHPKIAMTTYHPENDAGRIAAFLRKCWPKYKMRTKGIANRHGKPVMLHAWN